MGLIQYFALQLQKQDCMKVPVVLNPPRLRQGPGSFDNVPPGLVIVFSPCKEKTFEIGVEHVEIEAYRKSKQRA